MALTLLAQQFVDDGFVVVDNLLSRAELDEIVVDAAKFARGDYPVLNPPTLPEGATDDEALQHVLAVHFPHWVSQVALDMINHPGIAEVLHQIVGAHLARGTRTSATSPHAIGRCWARGSPSTTPPSTTDASGWCRVRTATATSGRQARTATPTSTTPATRPTGSMMPLASLWK